jgi:hypothetical protein
LLSSTLIHQYEFRLAMVLAVVASGASQRLRRLAARQFLVATYEVRSTA